MWQTDSNPDSNRNLNRLIIITSMPPVARDAKIAAMSSTGPRLEALRRYPEANGGIE